MHIRSVFGAVAVAASMFMSATAFAADIHVAEPWARASAGSAKAGAAFMTIMNRGNSDDRLIAVRADVSKRAELHTHLMEGSVMKMRQVEGVVLPAGENVTLQPGGLHVMFMGLKKPFKEGEHFPLTLVFEKAREITVDVAVRGVGAKSSGSENKHQHDLMKKTQ